MNYIEPHLHNFKPVLPEIIFNQSTKLNKKKNLKMLSGRLKNIEFEEYDATLTTVQVVIVGKDYGLTKSIR